MIKALTGGARVESHKTKGTRYYLRFIYHLINSVSFLTAIREHRYMHGLKDVSSLLTTKDGCRGIHHGLYFLLDLRFFLVRFDLIDD